jgi:hypothetical protein
LSSVRHEAFCSFWGIFGEAEHLALLDGELAEELPSLLKTLLPSLGRKSARARATALVESPTIPQERADAAAVGRARRSIAQKKTPAHPRRRRGFLFGNCGRIHV